MNRSWTFVLAIIPLAYPLAASEPATKGGDHGARAIARRALDAMGGEDAFARLRHLRFEFIVVRGGKEAARYRHVWDRHDGRYRVEGTNREGQSTLGLFNVHRRGEGRAWVAGTELAGEDRAKALERAYGRFINDTYWLLMPAKLLDPGVATVRENDAEVSGKGCEVLRVTFDAGIGLTPGDTYWAYVDRETGRMLRWDFVLEGQEAKERSTFLWEDWREIGGGVRLSTTKRSADGGTIIRFEKLEGSAASDDGAFAPP